MRRTFLVLTWRELYGEMRIGVDFGGVIVRSLTEGAVLEPGLGLQLEQPDALDCLRRLVKITAGQCWIISKASRSTQAATREWLGAIDFYKRTTFLSSNLVFCAKRSEKRGLCRELGISHFVDDSREVIESLVGIVPNLALFASTEVVHGAENIPNWKALMALWLDKN